MVFPTVSRSTRFITRYRSSAAPKIKAGPRLAWNIYDRIAAYDRGFQRFMDLNSKLAGWTKRMNTKSRPLPPSSPTSSSFLFRRYSSSSSSTCSSGSSFSPSHHPPLSSIHSMPLPVPMPKPSLSRRIVGALTNRRKTDLATRTSPPLLRSHKLRVKC
ncbi:hypothetical protein DM01DRAFT_1371887 [Hesseltinella vesiculosa]|uniref:Uncharacterized protein n=1 Tax=Hesseltinella vesiculosa TaxID=101127 RepID=A0A1X2GQ45_9FUNG|nr:hypothetical protein DM01DRAFT_1371887 [Hesseltinella vesiculosa]